MGIGSELKALKLGEEKRARVIVGHVRPDHIDEAGEHCNITFSFINKAYDDLILTLTCYEQKQAERKLFPHLIPRKRGVYLAHRLLESSSKKSVTDELDADLYLA